MEPYITYCSSVWSSPNKSTRLERVFKLQKAAIRIISHSHYMVHTNPIFYSLNLLKTYDLTKTALLILMHKFRNNVLPAKFCGYFQLMSQIHSHNTRGAHKYATPYARTVCRTHCLQFIGPRLWNSLPAYLQAIGSLYVFKSKLKQSIIDDYNV